MYSSREQHLTSNGTGSRVPFLWYHWFVSSILFMPVASLETFLVVRDQRYPVSIEWFSAISLTFCFKNQTKGVRWWRQFFFNACSWLIPSRSILFQSVVKERKTRSKSRIWEFRDRDTQSELSTHARDIFRSAIDACRPKLARIHRKNNIRTPHATQPVEKKKKKKNKKKKKKKKENEIRSRFWWWRRWRRWK